MVVSSVRESTSHLISSHQSNKKMHTARFCGSPSQKSLGLGPLQKCLLTHHPNPNHARLSFTHQTLPRSISTPRRTGLRRPLTYVLCLGSGRELATAAVSPPEVTGHGSGWRRNIELGLLLGLFYLLNSYFNFYSGQVWKVFENYPVNVTLFQSAVGSLLVLFMWTFTRPKLTPSQLLAILPIAVLHSLSSVFTNKGLGALYLLTPLIMLEPLLPLLLSAEYLGEMPGPGIVASLFLIAAGVGFISEFHDNSYRIAFLRVLGDRLFDGLVGSSAIAYIFANQYQHFLSKKLIVSKEECIDSITLFSVITVMSFLILLPATFFLEGFKYTPSYLKSVAKNKLNIRQLLTKNGVNVRQFMTGSLLAGLCLYAHQQVSYVILQKVSPVSHCLFNFMKRFVIIFSSSMFLNRPLPLLKTVGIVTALSGVLLYSTVKFSSRTRTRPNELAGVDAALVFHNEQHQN